MANLWRLIVLCGGGLALWLWYRRETIHEGEALVHLQSEHEHFHLHVDLPPGLEIEAGDTLEVLETPRRYGQTTGEISYASRVRLIKASSLRRELVRRSSLIEVKELVEHP